MIKPQIAQKISSVLLWTITLLVVSSMLFIIVYTVLHGWRSLNMHFVFGSTITGGLMAPILGTLYLILLTLLFIFPLGVGTAIYLSEYAPENKFTKFTKFALKSLAGIPSIIYGLFGVAFFVVFIGHTCILAGALTMACLSLPYMVTSAEEALIGVPKTWREASYALGATKWETTWKIVIPAALPGIMTGVILCAGRVVAETAPLLATVGFSPFNPVSPLDGARTLALELFYLATEAPSTGGITRQDLITQAMGVAIILFIIIILMNMSVRWIGKKYSNEQYKIGR
ncbi:MAG: phosphate ABC transporter permease PstA [Caldisericia bacterium]|nr:phosphate ABC transporter permease PstA [Caldisericia bacterium]